MRLLAVKGIVSCQQLLSVNAAVKIIAYHQSCQLSIQLLDPKNLQVAVSQSVVISCQFFQNQYTFYNFGTTSQNRVGLNVS